MMPALGEKAGSEELLARARAGEAEAFCRLMEPAEGRLFRQALALAGDVPAAEDLVAETLIGAWEGIARFDGGCRLSTWLYAILLHRFQKHVRRLRSRPAPAAAGDAAEVGRMARVLESVADGGPTACEAAQRVESAERMRRAVSGLPEEHRTVLMLRFFEEASLSEIASALGIPVGTVKSRLHHGLEKLRCREDVVNLWAERRDS